MFNNYITFEEHLFNSIRERWINDRKNDFIVCDALGEDYDNCNHAPYSWYMKLLNNGRLPTNVYNKISDGAAHKIGKEQVIALRKEMYESMMSSENIAMWCLENIQI